MKTSMMITSIACAAAICGGAFADETANAEKESAPEGWNHAMGEGLSYGEQKLLAFEAGLSFDSRYMTYGVIDGKDPILTPSVKATFADWVYLSVESIFDVTKGNGKRGGYGNRAGKYTTLDAIAGVAHEFELAEGFDLSFDFNYIYEYLPRHHGSMDDTQYLNLELGLSGDKVWLEPTVAIERDLMADDGTYVNFSLGHKFALVDGEEGEDPVLAFTPSVAQGFGNTQRTRGYELANDHGGLMDTSITGTFEWKIADGVTLSAYVTYADYWFDRTLRHGAREHNGAWSHSDKYANSWNIWGGLAINVEF